MSDSNEIEALTEQGTKKQMVVGIGVFASLLCTFVLTGLLVWNVKSEKKQNTEIILNQARAFLLQITTTRYWNAGHGGVYVPVTETNRPNPYLRDPDRDILLDDGTILTKVNPAMMTRQISEIANERSYIKFHITSLKPIQPANAAEPWEEKAMQSFRKDRQEYYFWDIPTADRVGVFRYMAPLRVEENCLKCHAQQGYKKGDLRGGISVSIDGASLLAHQERMINKATTAYALLWLTGIAGIAFGTVRFKKVDDKRLALIGALQKTVAEVKTLSGFLPICASCKKIRNDTGYWQIIEEYISEHSEAQFSHGICLDCARELYPEFYGVLAEGRTNEEQSE